MKSTNMTYKFNVGDTVKIILGGNGYSPDCRGEIVTILALGTYTGTTPHCPGYQTTKTKAESNANNGNYNYMYGEKSFELVQSSDYAIF